MKWEEIRDQFIPKETQGLHDRMAQAVRNDWLTAKEANWILFGDGRILVGTDIDGLVWQENAVFIHLRDGKMMEFLSDSNLHIHEYDAEDKEDDE